MPETRILSLEQLDIVFNQTTSAFREFAFEDASWLFKHYILRHKKMMDRPKFHERIQQQNAADCQRRGTEMRRPRAYSTSISDGDQQSLQVEAEVLRSRGGPEWLTRLKADHEVPSERCDDSFNVHRL